MINTSSGVPLLNTNPIVYEPLSVRLWPSTLDIRSPDPLAIEYVMAKTIPIDPTTAFLCGT